MTIGNAADAAIAFSRPSHEFFLGEGFTRRAYLINGVVYKVDMDEGSMNNWDEIHNIRRIAPFMPASIRLPEVSVYEFGNEMVVAMEYISGIPTGECMDTWFISGDEPCSCDPGTCLTDAFLHPLRELGIDDIGYGNLILSNDNVVYLIDVVC